MILEIFTELVAILAVFYAGISKFIQSKLIDRKEIEAIQAESKELNEAMKAAQKAGNKKKMEELMKKQMEFLPKMNKMMFAQFKPMIVIIAFFLVFTWGLTQIDPFVKDDITMHLNDDGLGCDSTARDGIFSACYELDNNNYGRWIVTAKSFRNGAEIGSNSTYFKYNVEQTPDTYTDGPTGEPIMITTDKNHYSKGETVMLIAEPKNADSVNAILDSGTFFVVDLPFQIPVLNVKRIYQPYWWFILVSLITNISLSLVMKKLRAKK